MSLFCGRFNLRGDDAEDAERRALEPMMSALTGKGAGMPREAATRRAVWGWKPSTRDCPTADQHSFLDDPASGRAIVGHVRIDNRAELRDSLSGELTAIGVQTDLALALAAYLKWGADCPCRLDGDFAFAVWEPDQRRAFCVRDHAGVIPFYYAVTPRALVFGSDPEAVIAAPDVPADWHVRNIADLLDGEVYLPQGETLLASVRRLAPGGALIAAPDRNRQDIWWRPQDAPDVRYPTADEYVEACRELLERAVAARAPAHDNVACHVSGGLDSSVVAALLIRARREQGRRAPASFTWVPEAGPDQAPQGEQAMLDAACEALELTPHRAPMDRLACLEFFARDALHRPTCNVLKMEIPVQRMAGRMGITTILTGFGGDQCLSFVGRGHLPQLLLSGNLAGLSREAAAMGVPLWRIGAKAGWEIARQVPTSLYYRKPFRLRAPSGSFKRAALSRFNPANRSVRAIPWSVRAGQQGAIASRYLENRLEAWAEHGSGRGLLYAYPLLDRRVMEFALGAPPELHRRDGVTRWLMRSIARAYVPEAVVMNTSKYEPMRVRDLRAALEGAVPALHRAVRDLDPRSERRRLVDVERLEERLRLNPLRNEPGRSPGFARVRAALEILDIDLTPELGEDSGTAPAARPRSEQAAMDG